MNFSLSDEQIMIRDAAQEYLAESCGSEALRAGMELPHGYDSAVWRSIAAELGWCALPVAEAHGGLGLGPVELMLIQEQAGYHLLSAPFFASACLGTSLLSLCADDVTRSDWLPRLAAGEAILSASLPSLGSDRRAGAGESWWQPELSARQEDGRWVLEGDVARVPQADVADRLLLTAWVDDDLALFLVDPDQPGVTLEPLQTWDASRRFCRARLSGADAGRCDAPGLSEGLRQVVARVRLYLAAEQLGAAQRCLDLSVSYVQERKQFGRPVGSFQAVKHRCAEMMVRIEGCRSAVYGLAALASGKASEAEVRYEAAGARALATETLRYCAGEAIQLHGGVGFTWEYDPQLYFKRAQASAHWLGEPESLWAELAEQLLPVESAESRA